MPDPSASKVCCEETKPARNLNDREQAIYRAVYYFNLFDYPIKVDELANFASLGPDAASTAVAELQAANLVEQRNNYVFIPARGWIIAQRERDEAFFWQHYKRIRAAAWFLSHIPFVRGIFLTGRTSKGLLSAYDDFDFLVVAEKNCARLAWILIFLFRRLISLDYRNGNFKWFCCNYVLGEDLLAIQDRDVFVAMEVVCSFPVFNQPLFERFQQANDWHYRYFSRRGNALPPDLGFTWRLGWVQRVLEFPFRLLWTAPVRRFVANYYRRHWLKLGMVKDDSDYDQKAGDGYVKPDTGGRRKFIVDRALRLDPREHNSFLRTKINLHHRLMVQEDRPHILLTHACLAQARHRKHRMESEVMNEPIKVAEHLKQHGYRAEIYDTSLDKNLTVVFRGIKRRLIALVGIYVLESTRATACRMIGLFHSIGARVVVAGPDAASHPQLYLDNDADVVITGDGQEGYLELLEHITKGTSALESIPGIIYPGKTGAGTRECRAVSGETAAPSLLRALLRRFIATGRRELAPVPAYDLWAATYDEQPANLMLHLDEKVFTSLLANIDLHNKTAVDIGCGTGRHWSKLLKKQPAELIGYDVSAAMLQRLQQKFPGAQTRLLRGKVTLLQAMPDASCDVVISTLTLAHIEDLAGAFAEWNRILKPTGEIVITDYHPTALMNGADRTFRHDNKPVSIKNYSHPLSDVRSLCGQLGWEEVRFLEIKIDEQVKHFYEEQKALHVYRQFYQTPIIYGWHLRKNDLAA